MTTRVLHLITGLEIGGAEIMLRNLVTRMNQPRFENVVVSMTTRGEVGEEIARAGVRVETLAMRRGIADLRGPLRLMRLLRTFRPDVVQTWLYHADILGTFATRFQRYALAWNVRCANTFVGGEGVVSRSTYKLLAWLSRAPRAVIANSRAGRRVHEELGYRPRRWEVIPNGFDTVRFVPDAAARQEIRASLGLPSSAVLLGLIARLDPLKDHAMFLRAAGIVAQKHDVHVILAGTGMDRTNETIRAWIDQNGLADRTHLMGERRDIERIFAALDIACSSSIGEGFPNTVGEAMSCGVPVVATDVGDTAWLAGEGTGAIVPAGNAGQFASALERVVSLPVEARRELGRRARQRIVDQFSIDAIVRRYEEFYVSLLTR